MGNSSCPAETVLPADPVHLFSHGGIHFQAHDVGWLVCGLLAAVAIAISLWLIDRHLANFHCPSQQRHIVRLLLMVPVFSVCSTLAYWDYKKYLYFDLVLECYEAVTIRAFFDLLLAYLSVPPDSAKDPSSALLAPPASSTCKERKRALQKAIDGVHLRHWMFPFGFVRFRFDNGGEREGEMWLWWMKIGVMQYWLIQILGTFGAIVAEALGDYCEDSWSPSHLHICIAALVSISISMAMYCVLQLYMPFSAQLAPFSPILKLLAIKLVVFFEFWQGEFFSFLQLIGVIKDHTYWTASEISIGLNSLCTCFEMVCFALLHIKAFSYLPYVHHPAGRDGPEAKSVRTKRWPAIKKTLVMSDVMRETAEEGRYMGRAMLGKTQLAMRRDRDLEEALSRKRDSGAMLLPLDEKQAGEEEQLEADLHRLARAGVNKEGVDRERIGPDGSIVQPMSAGHQPLISVPPPHLLTSPQAILALEDLYDGQVVETAIELSSWTDCAHSYLTQRVPASGSLDGSLNLEQALDDPVLPLRLRLERE